MAPSLPSIGRQASKCPALGQTRDHQQPQALAVRRGYHDVLHIGRAFQYRSVTQRADTDEYPGRQLEVLGDTAIEHQPLLGLLQVGRPQPGETVVVDPPDALEQGARVSSP